MTRLLVSALVALVLVVPASIARSDGTSPVAPASPPTTADPVPALVLPAPTSFGPGILLRRDLPYATGSGRPLHLDLYSPETSKGPLPFVLWIHGGGWVGGDKRPCGTVALVPKGYVTASVEYRFAAEAVFPAQIEDCKAAVRWVRANAAVLGVDPERIGAAGASAGGHLAALLGVAGDAADLEGEGGFGGVSSCVGAVCDIFGPTDLLHFDGHGSVVVANDERSLIAQLLGGPVSARPELAAKASPITYVTKDDPPFIIVHGDKDSIVPVDQSRLFDAALSKAGVDSTLVIVKGGGHAALPADVNAKIADFFESKLKAKKPAPSAAAAPGVVPAPLPVPVTPAMGAESR